MSAKKLKKVHSNVEIGSIYRPSFRRSQTKLHYWFYGLFLKIGSWGPSSHTMFKQLIDTCRDQKAGLILGQRISIAI